MSTLGQHIAPVFAAVLAVCDQQGLIGRETLAIDGVNLPSHASKQRSVRLAEFARLAATGKGVSECYTGGAAVDGTHQIVVEAQAHGTGSEQALLIPVVTAVQAHLDPATCVTADVGYRKIAIPTCAKACSACISQSSCD